MKFKVIGFVFTALSIFVILAVGMVLYKGWFEPVYNLSVKFSNIKTLAAGYEVKAASIKIGIVNSVSLANDGSTMIAILEIKSKYKELIRTNSKITFGMKMSLQGGDLFLSPRVDSLEISPIGDTTWIQYPIAPPNFMLEGINPLDLVETMANLNQIVTNLKEVLEPIAEGRGTIGKFLQDDQIFKQVQFLLNQSTALMAEGGSILKNVNSISGMASPMVDSVKVMLDTITKITRGLPATVNTVNEMLLSTHSLIKEVQNVLNHVPSLMDEGGMILQDANDMMEGVKGSFFLGGFFTQEPTDPILLIE